MIFLFAILATFLWDPPEIGNPVAYRVYHATSPVLTLAQWLYDYEETTAREITLDLEPGMFHSLAVTGIDKDGNETDPSNGIFYFSRDDGETQK